MRAEYVGVTGAIGLAVLVSYGVVVSIPKARATAVGPWATRRKLIWLWATATPITAAAFVLLWYAVAFSGSTTPALELFVTTLFLISALAWSVAIVELRSAAAIRAVYATAVVSVSLLIIPARNSSAIADWLLWAAAGWVIFHHVVIDGLLWGGKLARSA